MNEFSMNEHSDEVQCALRDGRATPWFFTDALRVARDMLDGAESALEEADLEGSEAHKAITETALHIRDAFRSFRRFQKILDK